jgi:hypothetical protein
MLLFYNHCANLIVEKINLYSLNISEFYLKYAFSKTSPHSISQNKQHHFSRTQYYEIQYPQRKTKIRKTKLFSVYIHSRFGILHLMFSVHSNVDHSLSWDHEESHSESAVKQLIRTEIQLLRSMNTLTLFSLTLIFLLTFPPGVLCPYPVMHHTFNPRDTSSQ